MDYDSDQAGDPAQRAIAGTRLRVGLLQGIIAWQLLTLVPQNAYFALAEKPRPLTWAQNHPTLFATMALVMAFLPVVALAELGRMRPRHLAIYLAVALVVIAGLTAYDIWRDPGVEEVRFWPSFDLIFCAGFGLFIVNQLLEHRERRHRLFTEYAAHFEDSWMRGFQVVLSLGFTLLVWGVLELGSALFGLIHVTWFGQMIDHNWFRCPVLAAAFAASVHISDVRPALLRGMRNLGLTLLSWLLPLVVALGLGFLVALLFTGLQPLWSTRFAATILLSAVAVTLVLLNAAYKDGTPANLPILPLRWVGRVAGPMMLALTLLALYAIAQRVGQHGWTPQRVRSSAVGVVALIYGGGYTLAAVSRGGWLKRLEHVNVVASLAILAILVALLTPIADPARLAVNSQVALLKAGLIQPGKFDYRFLHFDSSRYGTDALSALTHDSNRDVASRARVAQTTTDRYDLAGPNPAKTEAPLSHVRVYPAGEALPADFAPGNFDDDVRFSGASCLVNGTACDIVVWKDANNGGLLLIIDGWSDANVGGIQPPILPVFGRGDDGKWTKFGSIHNTGCPGVYDALRQGKAVAVRHVHDDLKIGDVRLTYTPDADNISPCPARPPVVVTPPPPEPRAPVQMGPAFGTP